jgi:hypothetical protein
MTPKEKAHELINKFLLYSDDGDLKNKYWKIRNAKQCALIAVDEILDDDMYGMEEEYFENRIDYWEQVKQEIEKL